MAERRRAPWMPTPEQEADARTAARALKQRTRFGVFVWRSDARYHPVTAIRSFVREADARRFADAHIDLNYVVRPFTIEPPSASQRESPSMGYLKRNPEPMPTRRRRNAPQPGEQTVDMNGSALWENVGSMVGYRLWHIPHNDWWVAERYDTDRKRNFGRAFKTKDAMDDWLSERFGPTGVQQITPERSRTLTRRGELPGADPDADVAIDFKNHRGEVFNQQLTAVRDPSTGPGWYVKGFLEAGGNYVRVPVARPNVPLRRWPKYNKMVMPGWRTKRDAERVIDELVRQGYGSR